MKKALRYLSTLALCIALIGVPPPQARSGGTDSRGGHHDRKRGGYHVHNQAKYYACNPSAPGCGSSKPQEPSRQDRDKTEPQEDEQEVKSQIVYVTKTGKKYHRGNCRYLRSSKIPMKLADAKKRYGVCSVCKPPS